MPAEIKHNPDGSYRVDAYAKGLKLNVLVGPDAAAEIVRCDVDTSIAPPKRTQRAKPAGCCGKAKRLAKGVIGLAKAQAGIDAASAEAVAARYAACNRCEHNDAGNCGLCGCWIAPKIRIAGEACPADPARW